MTRKHFEAIAATVNRMDLSFVNIQHVALMLANTLATTNERFDRERFVAACMKGH